MKISSLLGILTIAAASTAAQSAIVVATDFQTSGTTTLDHTYSPSSTDLLSGLMPTATMGNLTNVEGTSGPQVLTDGAYPSPITRAPDANFNTSIFTALGSNSGVVYNSLTYTLASSSDLASIVVYGGWQDGGRDQQTYSIFYAQTADPGLFLPLTTVDFNPPNPGTFPQATRVTITEDTLPALATDVAAIRFDFNDTENGYTGYAEIDVIAVPEPSGLGLLAASLFGALCFRRRR
ncbi:hypothetical protein BH23VER1_BH23VER1_02470 [soil metagenome]